MRKESIITIHKRILSSRNEARNIEKEIIKSKAEHIIIDFTSVIFVSGGFADEWLNVLNEIPPRITIHLRNIKTDTKRMIQTVQKRKEKIKAQLTAK